MNREEIPQQVITPNTPHIFPLGWGINSEPNYIKLHKVQCCLGGGLNTLVAIYSSFPRNPSILSHCLHLQLWVIYLEKKNMIVFTQKVLPILFWWDINPLMIVTKNYHTRWEILQVLAILSAHLTHLTCVVVLLCQCLSFSCCNYDSILITWINRTLVLFCLHSLINIWINPGRFPFDPEESACIQENSFTTWWLMLPGMLREVLSYQTGHIQN